MKNVLLKDTYREIKNSLGRFLSILAIVALGVAFFSGIRVTSPDMKLTAYNYYKEYNFMDIRLLSTIGFNDEDIKLIKEVDGVEQVLPSYFVDSITKIKDKELTVKVLAIPNDRSKDATLVNRPKLLEGRLPEKAGECVAERGKIHKTGLTVGSKLNLTSGTEKDINENLKRSEFTVVGIIESPNFISNDRGNSNIGNGKIDSFIMILEDDFNMKYFNTVYLTVKGAKNINSYSSKYEDIINPTKTKLENFRENRVKSRYNELVKEAQNKINDKKKELNDAEDKQKKELGEASQKIDDAKVAFKNADKEWNDKNEEFINSIKDSENKLQDGYSKLKSSEIEYAKKLSDFNNAKELAIKNLGSTEAQKDASYLEFNKMEAYLRSARIDLDNSKIDLDKKSKELSSTKLSKRAELDDKKNLLSQKNIDIEKAQNEFDKAKKDSDDKISDSKIKITDAEKELKKFEMPVWYVLDRNTNAGFVDYGMTADRIEAIAKVFPLIFFIVAALVCLTTMTRMVDEQRTSIGTLKALGYSKVKIAAKYILYASLACIGGSIIGIAVGFTFIPRVIFNAYSIMYTLPELSTMFHIPYALASTGAAILITTAATIFSSYKELRVTPSNLMRPKAPKIGKTIIVEKINFIWSRLHFMQKITVRNILRYKKRLAMTVIGIAGCTALLLSGFGLKNAISDIVPNQYGEIFNYDMKINYKKGVNLENNDTLIKNLSSEKRIKESLLINYTSVDASKNNVTKDVTLVVPESSEKLRNFINLRKRVGHKKLELKDDGVIITEKLSNMLKLRIGDEINIENDGKMCKVKVNAISENYVSHYIYMSRDLFESKFSEKIVLDKVIAKTVETEETFENNLASNLLEQKEITSINFSTEVIKNFKDAIKSLDTVVLVMIVSAAALAFIVLYNLTNINISERLREIATIKVLGFYDKEVAAYVYRENFILTILGVILGLIMGVFLNKYIVTTAEIEFVMFGRIIKKMSFVYAIFTTVLFTALVSVVVYIKLKKLRMVESLKSVD